MSLDYNEIFVCDFGWLVGSCLKIVIFFLFLMIFLFIMFWVWELVVIGVKGDRYVNLRK